jgi:hypothetical protein
MRSPEAPSFSSKEAAVHKPGDVLENIPFESNARRPDVYYNSEPGRKRIRLAEGSSPPRPGVLYNARIIEDTNPADPLKGEYVVEVTEAQEVPDWRAIEENVSAAEPIVRKARRASSEHHLKSPSEGEAISAVRKRILEHSKQQSDVLHQEAEERLGGEHSPERRFAAFRQGNLASALRQEAEFERKGAELRVQETDIIREMGDLPTGSETAVLQEIRGELDELKVARNELLTSSPEAYYGLHLRELKSYKEDLEKGKIVEIPYVREKIEDITTHIFAGKPVMVYGHLGSGKTELEMHIARNYMGKEALVISGSKDMSLAELYGHQVLRLDQIDHTELDGVVRGIETKYSEWGKRARECV